MPEEQRASIREKYFIEAAGSSNAPATIFSVLTNGECQDAPVHGHLNEENDDQP